MRVDVPMVVLSRLLGRAAGGPLHDLIVEVRPLRGGLESRAVLALTARFRDREGTPRLLHVVAKRLSGRALREASIYGGLVATCAAELAPRVLGVHVARQRGVLLLESLRRRRAWPWSDIADAAEVLRCVARLHQAPRSGITLPAWDYNSELARSAAATVEALERTRGSRVLDATSSLPPLRRVARDAAAIRRRLVHGPLPVALLHGDLHPGNVVVCRPSGAGGAPRIALIDWERARLGSPLEDVSSFLQSLAYWEPRVRARHDTLLGDYLAAWGSSDARHASCETRTGSRARPTRSRVRSHTTPASPRAAPPRGRRVSAPRTLRGIGSGSSAARTRSGARAARSRQRAVRGRLGVTDRRSTTR